MAWPLIAKLLAGLVVNKVGEKSPVVGAALGGMTGGAEGATGGGAAAGGAAKGAGAGAASGAAAGAATASAPALLAAEGAGRGIPSSFDMQALQGQKPIELPKLEATDFSGPDFLEAARRDMAAFQGSPLTQAMGYTAPGRIANAFRVPQIGGTKMDRAGEVALQTAREAKAKPNEVPEPFLPDTGFSSPLDRQRAFNARFRPR